MREFLIVMTGILMLILIMFYVASEAHFKGWMECYERMKEIDDSYVKSINDYVYGMEKQIKNYEEYTKQLREHIDHLERELAELRGEENE